MNKPYGVFQYVILDGEKYQFDSLPFIEIPNTPEASEDVSLLKSGLTIVHPFYNERKRFDFHVQNWLKYPKEVTAKLNIVLADDCSSPSVSSWFSDGLKAQLNLHLTVYRIMKDLKWNTPGALNLGIMNAPTDWVLIMDSDCLMDSETILKLMNGLSPNKNFIYKFMRNRVTNNADRALITRPLTCSLLFHKSAYESVDGFDEDFTGEHSGGYGFFDNYFIRNLARNPSVQYRSLVVKDVVITEYMDDVVGPNVQVLTGVQREHYNKNKLLWAKKASGEIPRSKERLRFEWIKDLEL